ncbi:hypothetical protein ACLVWQ_17740 (plasmid) [Streptomyces sp. CWNU-52B]|uniref:hypothetical protein n=1 Tax=unclassified Streptomyces TaxID=2593676 RepID=UPI0039C3F48D
MKCGEPNPSKTFADCDLELKHRDDHSYLGQRWPRVQPSEPDWDVQELLDDQTPRNAWGVMERSFPIIVTETVTRVVFVTAETEDQALAYWGDDPTDLSLDGSEVLDGSLEFERPDRWQRQDAFRAKRFESKIGPLVVCPGCGAEAFRREWMHNPMRKCHGPIEWRENPSAKPRYRWRREHRSTPAFDASDADE